MLSVTNSINDVKKKLRNDYSFFGFSTDALFVTEIEDCLDSVEFDYMYPLMGSEGASPVYTNLLEANNVYSGKGYYDYIKAKDKTNLILAEEYIYRAEVYFACAVFMERMAQDEKFNSSGGSISIPGYSASGGQSGDDTMENSSDYHTKAFGSLTKAGFDIFKIRRGGRG